MKCETCHRAIESQFERGTHHVSGVMGVVLGVWMIGWPEHAPRGWFEALGPTCVLLWGICQLRLATLGQRGKE